MTPTTPAESRLRLLCDRWNKAVTRYGPIAGSEYIDDPERSLSDIKRAADFGVGLERAKCIKILRDLAAADALDAIALQPAIEALEARNK